MELVGGVLATTIVIAIIAAVGLIVFWPAVVSIALIGTVCATVEAVEKACDFGEFQTAASGAWIASWMVLGVTGVLFWKGRKRDKKESRLRDLGTDTDECRARVEDWVGKWLLGGEVSWSSRANWEGPEGVVGMVNFNAPDDKHGAQAEIVRANGRLALKGAESARTLSGGEKVTLGLMGFGTTGRWRATKRTMELLDNAYARWERGPDERLNRPGFSGS